VTTVAQGICATEVQNGAPQKRDFLVVRHTTLGARTIKARIEQTLLYSDIKMFPPSHHLKENTKKLKQEKRTLPPVSGWDPPLLQGLEDH
jgi:hypothetical protein